MGYVIDVQILAQKLEQNLQQKVKLLSTKHITPTLNTILVGEDPASHIYVSNKIKKAKLLNIKNQLHTLPTSTTEEHLLKLINKLNDDNQVHGILVQLPLPKHINTTKILQQINPLKDVDGLHPTNAIKLLHNDSEGFVPCTPLACEYILKQEIGDLTGKNICIIGRSNLVGLPLFHLLLNNHATVTITHSKTLNLPSICKQAEIIVSAVGVSKFINQNYINANNKQTLIDVGISRIFVDGKKYITGDIDTKSVLPHVKAITPVPKGVGILTILFLMENVIKATNSLNS